MKKIKTVIRVYTQEEYNEIVDFFKSNGKKPYFAGSETDDNIFDIYNADTCIKISKEKILFGSYVHYKENEEFSVINFDEFNANRDINKYEGVERVRTESNKKLLADMVFSHCDDEDFDREELLHFSALTLPGLLKKLSKDEVKSVSKIKETASLAIIYAKECLSQIDKIASK